MAIWTIASPEAERFGFNRGLVTSSVEHLGPSPSTPESPDPKTYTFKVSVARRLRIVLGLGTGAVFVRLDATLRDFEAALEELSLRDLVVVEEEPSSSTLRLLLRVLLVSVAAF